MLGVDAGHEGRHLLGDEVVDLDGDAVPARLVDERRRLLDGLGTIHLGALVTGGAARAVDGGAGRAELHGDAPSCCPGGPGDQGDLAVE